MSRNSRNVYKFQKCLQKCRKEKSAKMSTNSRNVHKNVYNKKGLIKCLEMSTNSRKTSTKCLQKYLENNAREMSIKMSTRN